MTEPPMDSPRRGCGSRSASGQVPARLGQGKGGRESSILNLACSALDLSCSRAGAPDLEHVDLPRGLVDVEAATDQIATIAMVKFAAHQIREKQLPLLQFGEWQAKITLPPMFS
jgi:hypothetical protein